MRNILIRVDSSNKIGLGHLMRCLVLAKEFKNDKIYFASLDLEQNANNKISENSYDLILLKTNTTEELGSVIKRNNITLVIIDSYEIDYDFEKELKQNNKCELMVLDDTYEKHYCDILLNHNIYAQKELYKNRVLNSTKLLCGKEFTLIRDEFKTFEKIKKESRDFFKILISLGGADFDNVSLDVIKVVEKIKDLQIVLVTSSSNKNIDILKEYIENKNNISLELDSKQMAKLIYESNFAIISPSVIVHEVLYMEKDFISIKTAENQKYMHEYLEKNDYLVLPEFESNILKEKVNILLNKEISE